MATKTLNPAMLELADALNEARQLTSQPNLSKRDESRVNVLLAQIKTLRDGALEGIKADGFVSDPAYNRAFRAYLSNRPLGEVRDLMAGSQTITYNPAYNDPGTISSGMLVPTAFAQLVMEGAAQYDPLLDRNVVTLIQEKDFKLRPMQVPGWDLSKVSAVLVAENQLLQDGQGTNVDPVFSGKLLNRWSYRNLVRASFEWEEDEAAYSRTIDAMARAFGIGFGRGVGKDLTTGNGSSQPQGILTAAANSSVSNGTAGKISLTDILNIYFSVNRVHRIAPKCAWLMDDTSYKYVRAAQDNSNRPLLNVERDVEKLMGKPVYVCPSLAGSVSPIAPGSIVFGDLSHFVVHASAPLVRRYSERFADFAEGMYMSMLMVDSVLFDPTNGAVPPIVFAQIN